MRLFVKIGAQDLFGHRINENPLSASVGVLTMALGSRP